MKAVVLAFAFSILGMPAGQLGCFFLDQEINSWVPEDKCELSRGGSLNKRKPSLETVIEFWEFNVSIRNVFGCK